VFPSSVSAIALVIRGALIPDTTRRQCGQAEGDVADDSGPQFIGA
jgi:hypothetical protein